MAPCDFTVITNIGSMDRLVAVRTVRMNVKSNEVVTLFFNEHNHDKTVCYAMIKKTVIGFIADWM